MKPVRIKSLSDPGIEAFTRLSDKELERRGLFLAESPNVILRALENGFEPAALFCEETVLKKGSSAGSAEAAVGPAAGGSEAVDGFEAGGSEAAGGSDMEKLLSYFRRVPVYTSSKDILAGITGYPLTRGALCAFHRLEPRTASEAVRRNVLQDGGPDRNPAGSAAGSQAERTDSLFRRIAVVDGVVDAANVGTIFRGAAALGVGAVLLTRDCCDPLNRRTVRTSMGTVFQIPWAWLNDGSDDGAGEPADTVAALHRLGYRTAAMALRSDALSPDSPALAAEEHLAIILGNEGHGLPEKTIVESDYVVCIPMARGVDSLNVAAAAAIAFWQLR